MDTGSGHEYLCSDQKVKTMKKYLAVLVLGWQDALVYRFNALVWVLYAVLPSATFMLVWLAAYQSSGRKTIGDLTPAQMLTYYVFVTALSVVITSHPEYDIATMIRDGKITPFIVRPISFYGYRVAQETSYQIVKTAMLLPALALLCWGFRDYIQVPSLGFARSSWFFLSVALAYALLTQIKFLLGISAFWIAEPGGFLEIWNILTGIFGGRLLPLALLPPWIVKLGDALPFSSLYAFPMQLLLGAPAQVTASAIATGFARQVIWLLALSLLVRIAWRRGLLAYEAYGG